MVNEFSVPISLHTPQVYESVLLLHPSCALYQNYHVELKKESTLEAQETRASFPVIISHNGYTALSAKVEGDVCSLQLFDTETWSMKAKFETRDQISPVPSVMTLSLDGTKVAFATRNPDHPVVVWDTLWQDSLKNLLGHSDTVRYIEFIPNSTRVVSGSDDRTLRVWDWVEGTSVSTLIGHTDSINVVTLSPDGGYIVSGSNDKTIRVWVLVLKELAMVLEGHSHPVTCAAVSPDSRILVSGDQSGYMLLWDFKKGTILRACSASTNGPTRAINFSPDSGRMVFWSSMSVGYDELSDTLPVRYPRAGSDKLIFWRDDWIWELNSFGCLKRFWLPSYWYRADPASGRPHRNSFVMRGREDHDDLIIVDCRAGFSFTDPVSISQLVQNEGLSQLEDMRVLSQWPTMDPILTELPSSSLEDFTSHESKIAEKPNSDVVHPIPPLRYNLIGLTMEYPQPEAAPSTKNT
ncbi:hypothetical protein FRC03_001595 [Tulasnella sp. 419]|nr:hypothetical protein FRC03_001595 [Tulasnella sp. 419]